jgi:transposase
MSNPRKKRTGKKDFVSRAGRLGEMYVQLAILRAVIKHTWTDAEGTGWAVVVFNDTPFLAYERDAR